MYRILMLIKIEFLYRTSFLINVMKSYFCEKFYNFKSYVVNLHLNSIIFFEGNEFSCIKRKNIFNGLVRNIYELFILAQVFFLIEERNS